MFKDITLGQYFPGNSVVHRLDPRTKLILMMAYIVAVFLVKDMWIFLFTALYAVGVTLVSGVPLSYLVRSLKPLKFILIFMFIITQRIPEDRIISAHRSSCSSSNPACFIMVSCRRMEKTSFAVNSVLH